MLIINPVGEFHLFLMLLDDRQMLSVKDVSINSVQYCEVDPDLDSAIFLWVSLKSR